MKIFAVMLSGLLIVFVNAEPARAALQAVQHPPSATRVVGSITAIDGKSLMVKSDAGAAVTVTVGEGARILQTTPDAKTLATATVLQLTDLAVGDRVLMAVQPSADGSAPVASRVIVVKQADEAKRQQAEQSDWQHRGVGGVVKSVDVAGGTVSIASGARILTIRVSPKTIVRRYDPASIKYSDSKISALDQIHVGDQLQARGDRSADGEISAEEIIAGSFRNLSGTIVSVDVAGSSVTLNDLETKKPLTIRITADSQMHKLSVEMAKNLAERFKSAAGARAADAPAAGTGQIPGNGQPGASGYGSGQRNGSLSQMLQRAESVSLSNLHKGDAVMIVATEGPSGSATAVTLLAGVEPILTASASQNMFSASWNLGGGASAGSEGAQ